MLPVSLLLLLVMSAGVVFFFLFFFLAVINETFAALTPIALFFSFLLALRATRKK